jgi:hypothetical protein
MSDPGRGGGMAAKLGLESRMVIEELTRRGVSRSEIAPPRKTGALYRA